MIKNSFQTAISFKSWAPDEKPRQRQAKNGSRFLSDAEILANIIGVGTNRYSSLDLARNLLAKAKNDLYNLGLLTFAELTSVDGIGPAKAAAIISALELGRRRSNSPKQKNTKIFSSGDAYNVMKQYLSDQVVEQLWVIFKKSTAEVIEVKCFSTGDTASAPIDYKNILKHAINLPLCSSLILVHNHPAGSLQPSHADKAITKRLIDACKLVELKLMDHVIFTEDGYYSFADEGMLN